MIERCFYEKLGEYGRVYYQGGAPIITLSLKKCIKLLKRTAPEISGATAVHALSLTLKRRGGGLIGHIKAALANTLPEHFGGGRHRFEIVVVGSEEIVSAKLAELGVFVAGLVRKGYVREDAASILDGKLQVSARKPVRIDAKAGLYDLSWFLKDKAAKAAEGRYRSVSNSTGAVTAFGHSGSAAMDHSNQWAPPPVGPDVGPAVNPATGLPMIDGTVHDVAGNVFGQHNSNF